MTHDELRGACRQAFAAREYSEAWARVQSLIAAFPRDPEGHRLAGQLAVIRRQWRTALVAFRKLLALDAANPDHHLWLAAAELEAGFAGQAYRRLGEQADRLAAAAGSVIFGETEQPRAAWYAALRERGRERLQGDHRLLRRYLRAGEQFRELHRPDSAIASYRLYLEFAPDSYEAYCGLGQAYCQSRRDRDALEAYRHAAQRNPDAIEPPKQMGLLHLRLGEREQAAAIFQELVHRHPLERQVARYLENLAATGAGAPAPAGD